MEFLPLPLDKTCILISSVLALYKPLEALYHAMDMWHKAKSLNKALPKEAQVKGQENLAIWIDPIVNHFWYCCQECKGDVEDLKVRFFSFFSFLTQKLSNYHWEWLDHKTTTSLESFDYEQQKLLHRYRSWFSYAYMV